MSAFFMPRHKNGILGLLACAGWMGLDFVTPVVCLIELGVGIRGTSVCGLNLVALLGEPLLGTLACLVGLSVFVAVLFGAERLGLDFVTLFSSFSIVLECETSTLNKSTQYFQNC